ncbi:hypothetical protein CEXT_31671 [Caerostris extrusa]|uniref:Uncharacterized protein n=1 Tax=Caerostris extrusa TaxID=172846 RepID=A0AAV4YFK6_CAEEX|nr:hypothetical protein CEXT_31671 [Caerostris extrusa]
MLCRRIIDYHIPTTNRSCITDARRDALLSQKKIASMLPSCIGADGSSISDCSLEKQIQARATISDGTSGKRALYKRSRLNARMHLCVLRYAPGTQLRYHRNNGCVLPNSRKGKQKPEEGFPNRSGNNDTPSNTHLGRKNERLMRQRNIKRVLGAVPRRAPTESVNPHSEQLAMIRSSRKFVNCLPLGTGATVDCSGGAFCEKFTIRNFFLLYPFIREVFEETKH